MKEWIINRWKAVRFLFIYKICSTAIQLYIASLIATNGSSEEPWLKLTTIAHMGALIAALRGIDALIDPVFQAIKPDLKNDNKNTGTLNASGG